MGSSPRVRGSPTIWLYNPRDFGIIPAGAGLTPAWYCPGPLPGDHPRGCGAHFAYSNDGKNTWGSSPRVRGSLYFFELVDAVGGIIPAGAGLTGRSKLPRRSGWDHPRGCGAHNDRAMLQISMLGSSPRVRGSLEKFNLRYSGSGIIPAGAGLTSSRRHRPLDGRDHPRGCGAHL